MANHHHHEVGEVCLPQIQTNYLRIKDGSMPVSFVHKYIKKKLDLTSETDIVIKCMGQPVSPSLGRLVATDNITYTKVFSIRWLLCQGFSDGARIFSEDLKVLSSFYLWLQ